MKQAKPKILSLVMVFYSTVVLTTNSELGTKNCKRIREYMWNSSLELVNTTEKILALSAASRTHMMVCVYCMPLWAVRTGEREHDSLGLADHDHEHCYVQRTPCRCCIRK